MMDIVKGQSDYLDAGAPNRCFLPSCHLTFANTCIHGRDGHYYCSQECTDRARVMDLSHVEDIKRRCV
jgi:hypothetical protein